MKNVHPIVANLVSQQVLYLAVNAENSVDFLTDLRENMANPALQTEKGRLDAFSVALQGSIGERTQQSDMFNRVGATAVIPVHGALVNRFNSTYGYVTGYGYIKAAVAQAVADETISRVVLDVNSNGGEAAGCFETAAFIKALGQKKEIHAVIDSNCYSAAYAIASACASITATPSAGAGSIGVVAVHASYEKMLESIGIKATFIQAGDKKTLGNPYQDLSDDAKADIQQRINNSYNEFTSLVANNRGIAQYTVIKTQAACYTSKEAKERGLIDAIMSVEQAFDYLTTIGEETMSDEKVQVDAESKQTDGAASERQRIQAIMTCDAAKELPNLANHFAFNTSMNVDDAVAALNAAKADSETKAAAVETENKQPVQEPNYLATAMAQNGTPNIGADAGNEEAAKEAANIQAVAKFANLLNM